MRAAAGRGLPVVLVDAFDSFVYVIDRYLAGLGAEPVVLRSTPDDPQGMAERVRALRPQALVLGPGPGHPLASGHVELVREFTGELPVLGVCLGHQAIGAAHGATVSPAANIMHGKTSVIEHDGRGLFTGAGPAPEVTRYHSLVVEEATVPPELEVSARSRDDGYVMGLRHRTQPLESVQFHPESITTRDGLGYFRAFLDTHLPGWSRRAA